MNNTIRDRLIVAIDTADIDRADHLVTVLRPHVAMFKLGLEFFSAHGPDGVRHVTHHGLVPFMLDLKLHDIPETVARAVRALLLLQPRMITIHAAGGPKMIRAARDASETTPTHYMRAKIIAVTVLSSSNERTLTATGIDADTIPTQVYRLGNMALRHGADGLVCPPFEVMGLRALIKEAEWPNAIIVSPGIRLRLPPHPKDDHYQPLTPGIAIQNGADWIVVGRPITHADDPVKAAKLICGEQTP